MKRLIVLLVCCGCASEATNDGGLFAGAGGVAGAEATGGVAGTVEQDAGIGGQAGAETGGGAGQAPFCEPGSSVQCACWEGAGHQSCNEQGTGYGVCRNEALNTCCGAPDGWLGCGDTGCGVCKEALAGFPNYTKNHPDCFLASGCVLGSYGTPGAYGACSSACPSPTDADR